MITYEQYAGEFILSTDLTGRIEENIRNILIPTINDLCAYMKSRDVIFHINPNTDSCISGQRYGGFRPQSCPIGAPKSNHKMGLAVDIYDPDDKIDNWCMNNLSILAVYGVWLEHPDATKGWCHLQVVPPRSGNRVFRP